MRLDDELAAFVQSGVSITASSRNLDLVPSVARAKGCRVCDHRSGRLRIFISSSQAEALLHDVQQTGTLSVTFSMPDTHRSLQFKSTDAQVTTLQSGEEALLISYVETFGTRIAPFGFSTEFTHAFFAAPADEVAIEFTVSDAFLQTPGPGAGSPL
jgi:hypothetical protein